MLEGSMVALITPLQDDRVDEQALRRLVRFHEDNGTDVIVPCGTTGESATLSYEEHERVIEIVVDESDRADVMAGTGSNSTHEAIRLTRFAHKVGCDAGLVITPDSNTPPQRGMVQHFRTLANSVDLDLVLYNVPSRTGINLKAETVSTLAEVDNIIGIKEASGDLNQVADICRSTPEDFVVLSGDDALTLPVMSVGGRGVVSVVGNLVPGRLSEMVKAWLKGNPVTARERMQELLPLMNAMFWETNPIPVKAAASMLGLCNNSVRSPLSPLEQTHMKPLAGLLSDLGLNVDVDSYE